MSTESCAALTTPEKPKGGELSIAVGRLLSVEFFRQWIYREFRYMVMHAYNKFIDEWDDLSSEERCNRAIKTIFCIDSKTELDHDAELSKACRSMLCHYKGYCNEKRVAGVPGVPPADSWDV